MTKINEASIQKLVDIGVKTLEQIDSFFGEEQYFISLSKLYVEEGELSDSVLSAVEVSEITGLLLDDVKDAFVMNSFINERLDDIVGSDLYWNSESVEITDSEVIVIGINGSKTKFDIQCIVDAIVNSDDIEAWTFDAIVNSEKELEEEMDSIIAD